MDEVGAWCQVPELIAHELNPSPTETLSHSRIEAMLHSKPSPYQARNPHFYPALVTQFEDTVAHVDNSVSSELMESFALAASHQQSSHFEANTASDMDGLMQLLSCTNMNLS